MSSRRAGSVFGVGLLLGLVAMASSGGCGAGGSGGSTPLGALPIGGLGGGATGGLTVVTTTPLSNAVNVSTSDAIRVTFDQALLSSSVTKQTVFLRRNGVDGVGVDLSLAAGNTIIVITPMVALQTDMTYTAQIGTGVRSVTGNAVDKGYSFSFSTGAALNQTSGDTLAPTIVNVNPYGGSSNVPPNVVPMVMFSESMDPASISNTSIVLEQAGRVVASWPRLSQNDTVVSLTLDSALLMSTMHTLRVTTMTKDLAGNPLAVEARMDFTTAGAGFLDSTGPTVTSTAPPSGATNVALTAPIVVTFSEPVNPATVTTNSLTVKDSTGATVPGTVAMSNNDTVATFTPTAPLKNNETFTVTTASSVTDKSGNALNSTSGTGAAPHTFTFGTGTGGAGGGGGGGTTTGFTVIALVPNNGATTDGNLSPSGMVTATFGDNAMNPPAQAVQSAGILPTSLKGTFEVRDSAGALVPGSVLLGVAPGDSVATWTPSNKPLANGTYTVTINGVTEKAAPNRVISNYTSNFTVGAGGGGGGTGGFTVVTIVPADKSTNVPPTTVVDATFSAAPNTTTGANGALNPANFTVTNSATSTPVPGSLSVAPSPANTVRFTPTNQLANGTYIVTIQNVSDSGGTQTMIAPFTSTFTVGPAPLTVTNVNPSAGAIDHFPYNPVVLTFSEPIDISRDLTQTPWVNRFQTTYVSVDDGTGPVRGTVVFSQNDTVGAWWPEANNTEGALNVDIGSCNSGKAGLTGRDYSVAPYNFKYMDFGKTYTMTVDQRTQGANTGNQLGTPWTTTFTTYARTKATQLGVLRSYPFPNQTNVGVRSPVEVQFEEGINVPASNGGWPIEVRDSGGKIVTGSFFLTIWPGTTASQYIGDIVQFRATNPLSPNSTYTVKLPTTIVRHDGKPLAKQVQYTFTTGSAGAGDTQIPFTMDPLSPIAGPTGGSGGATGTKGTFQKGAFNPSGNTQPFQISIAAAFNLVNTQPEPPQGVEIYFNEPINPDTVSLNNVRYAPFDTAIGGNMAFFSCTGGCTIGIFGNCTCPCKFLFEPPMLGVYSNNDTASYLTPAPPTKGTQYGYIRFITDIRITLGLGQSVGVNANAVYLRIASTPWGTAGSSVKDLAGNPFEQNADNNGNGVVFSVQ